MTPSPIFAVIPSAGRGTRLGSQQPKVFLPITSQTSIWDILQSRISPHVDKTILVLSPEGAQYARSLKTLSAEIAVQKEPGGTGPAVFAAEKAWAGAESILVIWGDQLGISSE